MIIEKPSTIVQCASCRLMFQSFWSFLSLDITATQKHVQSQIQLDFYNPRFLERSAIAFDTEGFVEFLTPPDNVWTLPLLGHSVCCFLYRAAKKHVWRINECNGHNITFVVDQHQGSCKYRSEKCEGMSKLEVNGFWYYGLENGRCLGIQHLSANIVPARWVSHFRFGDCYRISELCELVSYTRLFAALRVALP